MTFLTCDFLIVNSLTTEESRGGPEADGFLGSWLTSWMRTLLWSWEMFGRSAIPGEVHYCAMFS